MPTATITTKGQITIPKEVRDRLGLAVGDRLEFVVDEQGTVVLKPARRAARDLYGFLRRRRGGAATPLQMGEGIAEVVAEDQERIAREE